jgi:rod shape determining protein RodA
MAVREDALNPPSYTLLQKLWQVHWLLVIFLIAVAAVGFGMLYSAAGGDFNPWASRQMVRFAVGMGVLILVAMIDIRLWLRYAYVFYFITLCLLLAVEFMGVEGKGAQRWLDLGYFGLQPSELMKIALVLALARYFHGISIDDVKRIPPLFFPLILVSLPAALVLRQPDLGTALMLIGTGGVIFFTAGVRLWKFAVVVVAGLAALPIVWQFLREYQKQRVLTFLNPENDPLGAGYHIIQSKIAFGSGGLFGKGYLQGTQSHLNFLPEMQTDFIFTMLAEEFGLVGGLVLLALYLVILVYGVAISVRCRTQFGRLVGAGVSATFFLYLFINMAMVMGLVPVVGVPLPLVSYGGTAMMTLLFGFGLLMGTWIHRDVSVGRRGIGDDF